MMEQKDSLIWHVVLENRSALLEGRVMTVTAGNREICLTHHEGKICALDNRCPHQGGPLGEGSIENGILRCPWHGWDYYPCSGRTPGFEDGVETYPVRIEDDQVLVGLASPVPHVPTLSDRVVATMIAGGVDTVFGMVGHSNLGLADAFRRREDAGELQFFGIRHEGAAAFAASAYGKLTGRPAACFAIAGPGSTNLYTGLWDARVDRAPLLALTGQVATQVVGTGNFQELDLVGAFQNVALFNQRVQQDSPHTELMLLALKHALLERGPVHLTFPDEVQTLPSSEDIPPVQERITNLEIQPPAGQLKKAITLLRKARRPVIIMGHGARFHRAAVRDLAESLSCPVLTTFKGKGLIADSHPLGCGVLGRSGTPVASWFMNESDLLIVIGASFSNHTGITPKKPTIQIDFDPLALAKFHVIEAPVYGEISVALERLRKAIAAGTQAVDQAPEIKERKSIWKREKERRLLEDRAQGLSASVIFDSLSRHTPANAVITVDVGNNAYSLGRYFECTEQSFLMSGYLGSIGFALPAAMGAWAAVKGRRPVLAVAGDGGLCQYLAEITTLVKYGMEVKVVVLNNNELGKISKEQRSSEFPAWQTDLVNPDFAEFARSCGAWGLLIHQRDEVESAVQELFATPGPGLLEVSSDVKLI